MPSEYYVKQAELAARLALAESDPERARVLHILALEHYDKADKARAQDKPPAKTPNITQRNSPLS